MSLSKPVKRHITRLELGYNINPIKQTIKHMKNNRLQLGYNMQKPEKRKHANNSWITLD